MTSRRFPPPGSIENVGAAFVVKDGAGHEGGGDRRPGSSSTLGTRYVRAAVGHHGSTTINASIISPEELRLAAGPLTATVVEPYF